MNIKRAIERRDPALVEAGHHLVARDGPSRRTHEELQDIELECGQPQRALVAPGLAGAGNEPDRAQLEHLRRDSPRRVHPAEYRADTSKQLISTEGLR